MLLSINQAQPPSTETISWTTQVLTSYNGHEERHTVRLRPRMSYAVTIPLRSKTDVDEFKRRDDRIRDELQFVVWHAAYDNEQNTLRTTRGHPWYFEFGSDDQVAHLRAGTLRVSNSVVGSGYVYPVRDAIVHGNLGYQIRRGGGIVSINYNVEQAVAPPVDNNFATSRVGGVEYELLELPTRSGFTQAVIQQQGYFDSVVGKYLGTTRWQRPKLQWRYTIEMFSAADVLKWKQFLFRRQGRYSPVIVKDTNGEAILMRLATDSPSIIYQLGYSTSTVPLVEVFSD